jgi:hypothetical protein
LRDKCLSHFNSAFLLSILAEIRDWRMCIGLLLATPIGTNASWVFTLKFHWILRVQPDHVLPQGWLVWISCRHVLIKRFQCLLTFCPFLQLQFTNYNPSLYLLNISLPLPTRSQVKVTLKLFHLVGCINFCTSRLLHFNGL